MSNIEEDQLQKQTIDLHAAKRGNVNEEYYAKMGSQIKLMLMQMFPGNKTLEIPFAIKGTPSEIKSFAKVLNGERRYAEAYRKFGLSDPRVYKNKYSLEKSIKDFESATNLKWPVK